MNIPVETRDRLLRMAGIERLLDASGWEGEEELLEEYRAIQKTIVDEFLPLVQLLVAAGAITLHVRNRALAPLYETAQHEGKKYDDSQFQANEAWENGNIWIISDEWAGGSPAEQKPKPETQPNGLN